MLMNSNEYLHIVESIKQEIRTAQYRAAVSVNRELLLLYHSIGEVINAHKTWGSKFVENLAADIKLSFPDATGYSVVIELKTGEFKPEYAGQLNFYLSAVDGILKKEQDNPSIGLLLCKSKNDLVAEYSLKDVSKPIGVSAYQITSSLPEELERQLPSVEDIQKRIKGVKE